MELSRQQIDRLQDLQQHLEGYRLKLSRCDYINEKQHFFEVMTEFWQFLSSYSDEETYRLFEHSQYFHDYRNFFIAQEDYYVRTIEAIEAVSIMTKQYSGGQQSFMEFFNHQMAKENFTKVSHEMELLQLERNKGQKLVMVGCGPLPETLLFLKENGHFKEIYGLDSNQEAIYMAGEMLASMGLDNIRLLHFNGLNYDYSGVDVVFVANFTRRKREVLNRIAETADTGTKILVRTPVLLGRLFYEPAEFALHNRLSLLREGEKNQYFLDKALVLEKMDI